MNRVATIPVQQTLSEAIQRSQQKLAVSQRQLSTGKKAPDYASLGTEAVRTLSARTMLERQEAHGTVARRLGTTLALQDAHLGGIETGVEKARQDILAAIGTGRSAGLQETIEGAFANFRSAMNAAEGGVPMFAGSRTDSPPFKPATLAEAAATAPAEAFGNDRVKASARVAEGLDLEYGLLASDIGTDIFSAFRALAGAGAIGDVPSEAQLAAMNEAISAFDAGLRSLRAGNAENGRRQAQVEALGTRAEERGLLLRDMLSANEDADLGEVAVAISQHQMTLQASYSVFAQLSRLSLATYLR
jgi:flagellar hook-associated protein 3 FlgL